MSDFCDMMIEMLPLHSQLQKKDNPLRIVLDRTIGAYMDDFEIPYEQIFVTTATGGWLDAWGKDYGVPRKIDEDDEHYRQRIIYEKLDHLTPSLLSDVYNVKLFTYRGDFNVSDNTLVSDNPHIVMNESFLGLSDEDTIRILDKKFILDSVVTWINDTGDLEYILDTRGKNILSGYSKIYNLTDLEYYFMSNNHIKEVKLMLPNVIDCEGVFARCSNLISINLNLPKAINCKNMFWRCSSLVNVNLNLLDATNCMSMFDRCSNLVSIDLNLPNVTDCRLMFDGCSNLVNVKLNSPKLNNYNSLFGNASNIETIDVTIPTSIVNGFKSYVTGLNLQHLTSFKINGEEQL